MVNGIRFEAESTDDELIMSNSRTILDGVDISGFVTKITVEIINAENFDKNDDGTKINVLETKEEKERWDKLQVILSKLKNKPIKFGSNTQIK